MKNVDRPSRAFLIAWNLVAAATLLLLLPRLKFGIPFWDVKEEELTPFIILLGGYVICALLSIVLGAKRQISFVGLLKPTAIIFGFIFFYFLVKRIDSSRYVMFFVPAATQVLISLPFFLGRFRAPAFVSLGVVLIAGLALYRSQMSSTGGGTVRTEVSLIQTGFYNLRAVSYQNQIPAPAVRGGGISKIGDSFLLVTGEGKFYLLGWDGDQDPIKINALPYRVPINGDEFAKDTTGRPWRRPAEDDVRSAAGEDAGTTVIAWWFRVAGLLVQELDGRLRIFASHYYWKHDAGCWVERVSMMEGNRDVFLKGGDGLAWRTLFETQPCLPIKGENARRGTPFAGHFGGGRMVLRDPDTLLLSVGDFGFNGVASKRLLSQDMSASYGKIIQIHLTSGESEIYTSGNRNPQGLYIDPNGKIWDTEHGPRGGDELNLIKQGANYGWPIVTYGVDYGTFAWPLNPRQGEHDGFEAPFYAWLPSIGVSNLTGVEKNLFPIWRGDLLVTSLVGKSVFRIRIRNDRVVYAEPILIGKRIRDIAEGSDGRIVLWADDDDAIITLRPLYGTSGEVMFATNCSGCHKVGDGTSHRIGPDLWGVIGRKVASAEGYVDYSPALRAHGGTWTEAKLDEFIRNPQAVVPGSGMEFDGVSDSESRAKIIDYLKHAPKIISK